MAVGIGSVEKQGMVVPMERDHAIIGPISRFISSPMGGKPPRQRGAISVRELSDSGKKGGREGPFFSV